MLPIERVRCRLSGIWCRGVGHSGKRSRQGWLMEGTRHVGLRPCGLTWLVRHGQTVSNLESRYAGRGGEPLTDAGRAQMASLGDRLSSRGIRALWSSELARAQESARILADVLDVPLRTEPRLNEMLLGPWEGLTEDEVAARFPEALGLWRTRPDRLALDGRETLEQVSVRISSAVREAAALPRPAVLLTHVAPIRVAALTFLGLPLRYYKRVDVGNAAAILVEPDTGRVSRLGERSLLVDELLLPTAVGRARDAARG